MVKTYPKRQRVDKTVRKKTSEDTCSASTEMILMKKLGMFYRNTIGFGAVRMTVVPGNVDMCMCESEDSAEGFVCSICQNVFV